MAFTKTVRILGDADCYTVSQDIKKYSLLDLGFERTRQGNYRYQGSLDRRNPFKPLVWLQITINQELTAAKMDTINFSGLRKINIFQGPRSEEFVTQYHFILDEMVARGIFVKQPLADKK